MVNVYDKSNKNDFNHIDENLDKAADDNIKSSSGLILDDDFESTYNDYFGDEDKLADTAFGINGRIRLSLEYQLISALSIGVQGSSGYHYIITGEEAASSTKSVAIDGFIASYPIPDAAQAELKKELKEILGAEEVDVNDLKGVNYSVGAFLNLSF